MPPSFLFLLVDRFEATLGRLLRLSRAMGETPHQSVFRAAGLPLPLERRVTPLLVIVGVDENIAIPAIRFLEFCKPVKIQLNPEARAFWNVEASVTIRVRPCNDVSGLMMVV